MRAFGTVYDWALIATWAAPALAWIFALKPSLPTGPTIAVFIWGCLVVLYILSRWRAISRS